MKNALALHVIRSAAGRRKVSEAKILPANTLERHAQTVLVLLLVALLLWVGNTTQGTAVAVAEMRVELSYLKTAVEAPISVHTDIIQNLGRLQQRVTNLEDTARK